MNAPVPTVSVVIPTYNASGFIGEALESVFQQTYQDFEILVVDDGSTDDTAAVVRGFGSAVRFIQQEHAGPSRARNRGISEAKGSYIAFLDADDLWLPQKLEKQLALFRADPTLGLVTVGHQAFDEEGVYEPTWDKRADLFGDRNVATAIFLKSNVATPTVMVPRSVLEDVGGFEEEIYIGEDDNLWIRIAAKYRVGLIDDLLVQLRRREDSLTKDKARLLRDVRKNITFLCERYPHVWHDIKDAVPEKLTAYYLALGYNHFESGDYSEARVALRTAIEERPQNLMAWAYLLLSSLPPGIIRPLRRLKGSVPKKRGKPIQPTDD